MASKEVETPKEGKERTINIPTIEIGRAIVTVEQLTPLIVHRFSEKKRQEMLDKHMKKARGTREAKDPEANFRDALYIVPGREEWEDKPGKFFFPSGGFKRATVGACRYIDDMSMEEAKGLFFVEDQPGPVLRFDELVMREDVVSNSGKVADIRHRPQFNGWACDLDVSYNHKAVSLEQLVTMIQYGGFHQGIGEWRPSSKKGGDFGRYRVSGVQEVQYTQEVPVS